MASISTTSSLTGYSLPHNSSSLSPADFDARYNTYLELLTRLTRHRSSSQIRAGRSYVCETKDRVMHRLLALPAEIRLCVLFWLRASDLLNLRATSHALHEFVHESESALCHSFPRKVTAFYGTAMPQIDIRTFAACIQQDLKYSSIAKCANVASQRICANARHPSYSGDDEGLRRWQLSQKPRLTVRITRAFILLQQYLDLFRDILISNDPHLRCLPGEEYTALSNMYDLDQQKALEAHMPWLTEQDFHDMSTGLSIIRSICRVRKVPLEQKSGTYPRASVRSLLILLGIPAMKELWTKNIDGSKADEHSEEINELNKKLSPYHQPKQSASSFLKPLETIHHLAGYGQAQELFHEKVNELRIIEDQESFLEKQNLWDRAAQAVMMRKLGRPPAYHPTSIWLKLVLVEGTSTNHRRIILGPWDVAPS